jgi:hypothetical protein
MLAVFNLKLELEVQLGLYTVPYTVYGRILTVGLRYTGYPYTVTV